MVMFVFLAVDLTMKEQLRFVIITFGELLLILVGLMLMPELYAINLATLLEVSDINASIYYYHD